MNEELTEVDGAPIARSRIARRGPMNFGQNWRGLPVLEVPYRLSVAAADVVTAIDALLRDFKTDSDACPDPEDELERRWRAAGWAAGETAIRDPALLPLLVDFLAIDLLDGALVTGAPDYLVNSVDGAELRGAWVVLTGVAGVVASMGRR